MCSYGECVEAGKYGTCYLCAGCRSTLYCGAACQQADWKMHKRACRAAKALRESQQLVVVAPAPKAPSWASVRDKRLYKSFRSIFPQLDVTQRIPAGLPGWKKFEKACDAAGMEGVNDPDVLAMVEAEGFTSDNSVIVQRFVKYGIELVRRMEATGGHAAQ